MSGTIFKARGGSEKPFSVEYETGDRVFAEGDLGTEMYVLQTGRVEVTRNIDGEEQVLAVLEKGDFFGEMAILEGLPRTATVVALEPTRAVRINASTFGQMLIENSEISIRMMRKLSRRLRLADQLLSEVGMAGPWSEPKPLEAPPEAKPTSQFLLHEESGETFYLAEEGDTRIGRRDPVTGIHPEIDLSEIDEQRSTSRRHATIRTSDGSFFLVEEIGTTNGTFVKAERLETDVPVQIEDGDAVRFGLVDLTFRVSS